MRPLMTTSSIPLKVIFVQIIESGFFHYFKTIEYFRLNIEYLRYSFDFKKDGAKRHQQIFNLQYSIFNSGLPGLGVC